MVETLWSFLGLPFGRDETSTWASHAVVIAQLIAAGLIFRIWLGPFILERISHRLQVRRVSLRSVRGLYVRTSTASIRIDRVGLSYHPSPQASRRFGLKVEGVHIEVHEIKTKARSPAPAKRPRRFTRIPSLAELEPSTVAGNILSSTYKLLDSIFRPVIRTFFVASARLVIKCLPALTQVVDFELDRAVVTFRADPEVHIAVKGMVLSATVSFTKVENVVQPVQSITEPSRRRIFAHVSTLRSRVSDSARRVLGRAWGDTQGSAAFFLTIEDVAGFLQETRLPSARDRDGVWGYNRLTAPTEVASMPFNFPGCTELGISFRFGPTKQLIEDRSICVDLKLPPVSCEVGILEQFLDAVDSLRTKSTSDTHSMNHTELSGLSSRHTDNRQLKSNPKIKLLRFFELTIKSVSVSHALPASSKSSISLLGHIHGLSSSVELGEPRKRNALHHEHLSRNCADEEDDFGTVISASFSTRGISVHRRESECQSSLLRVVSIGSVAVTCLTSNWLPLGPRKRLFSGDPNAALIALKLVVIAPQLSERLDVLAGILDNLPRKKGNESTEEQLSPILRSVPQIHFEVSVEDIAACIRPGGNGNEDTSSLILCSTQCALIVSTCFRSYCASRSSRLPDHCVPMDMLVSFRSVLGPAFVMTMASPLPLDSKVPTSSKKESHRSGDPLLSLTAIEVEGSSQILAGLVSDEQLAMLDLTSAMTELSCVAEAISIELWQPSSILLLQRLMKSSGFPSTRHPSTRPKQPGHNVFDALPRGISAHFAVGEFALIVTGKDINPDEDLDLSRGVGLKSGIAIQVCTLDQREHYKRLPKRFPQARERSRLLLFEGLTTEAIAVSTSLKHAPKKLVLVRSSFWNVSVRTAVATEYAADHPYDSEDIKEIAELEFLWIKRLEGNVIYSHLDPRETNDGQKRLQISLQVPYIRSHFRLLNAYCILLSMQTVKSLVSDGRHPQPKDLTSPRSLAVSVRASIHTVQVMLDLPLGESLCIRLNNMNARHTEPGVFQADFGTFFVWVPTAREDCRWEELLRLRHWKSSITGSNSSSLKIDIVCDGARLRIPHKYILADLILSLNVFVKSVKHLRTITYEGRSSSLGLPPVEDAKRVPSIALNIGCISLEAADDPFEATLGLIHKIGPDAARARAERDGAFEEKVDAIMAAGGDVDDDELKRFTPQHTVSVEEAHERLLLVHSMAWCAMFRDAKEHQKKAEEGIRKKVHGNYFHYSGLDVPPMVSLAPPDHSPPLLRIIASHFNVNISSPRFGDDRLVDFLHDLGKGIPRNTQYSLLIPLHLNFAIGASCVTLRDYPLPALNIVQESPDSKTAWVVDGDFVIAEEIGSTSSVEWKECLVVPSDSGVNGSSELTISVPKTTMPVKTYTDLTVNVSTDQLTEFCWAVSYAPALQDVMRVLDTLSTPPPDPSPVLGFWDKLRLVLHWRVMINFASEIRLNLKGSRNPYEIEGEGSGFSFCWDGATCIAIGHDNDDRELLQVRSDKLFIVIPKFGKAKSEVTSGGIVPRSTHEPISLNSGMEGRQNDFTKICAKINSGIKLGIGFVLERTCGSECSVCSSTGACRVFDFRPHYDVSLTPKTQTPSENSADDSFTGFRSSFIHMSISLSSTPTTAQKLVQNLFHLSPKTFTHFWSWWGLFDRSLSLPTRQGKIFPNARPPSKKFGQHLATLKYRFSVENLFISHVYKDDSRRSWAEGLTHCVGVKALIRHFEADMHQREQEITVMGKEPGSVKRVHHKRFYAIEVKLIDLRLRAILAVFNEPLNHLVDFGEDLEENRYQDIKLEIGENESRSTWFDIDDFVETDWSPPEPDPAVHITSIASCPRFTYFKQPGRQDADGLEEESRFGSEDTHVCLMGKEPSVHQSQSEIVVQRISELTKELTNLRQAVENDNGTTGKWSYRISDVERKIRQLERHARQLQEAHEPQSKSDAHDEFATYLMPSDINRPDDWTDFDNVYQAHCPKLCLSNSSRTILTQYYYCSRSRRGLEYHLATRAVKFIRDQADAHIRTSSESLETQRKGRKATGMAAQAIKKILSGVDHEDRSDPIFNDHGAISSVFDPMSGWSKDDVSLNKGHFCLLLKPQLILRSDIAKDSILVLACTQASLQSYTITDRTNIDDPVTGKIMTRNAAELSGFQTFSPSPSCSSRYDGVPLEVLIDLRAESRDFDRLVPQTDATFRYDKFNRLRLRNNVTSMAAHSEDHPDSHLQHQMDLIDISMPRFSVSANSKGFDSIANIITNLLLQSDSIHKERLSKIETLLFSYDFTDLYAASVVIEDLQTRVRGAMSQRREVENLLEEGDEQGHLELLRMDAHIFLLAEELNLIFNAIQLAQQKQDDRSDDTKLALKVRASSREISWGMVDNKNEIIAKLALRGIDFTWINRQDGSIVNNLLLKDIQVFDGSPDAEWPEILTKYQEPSNHPLVKKGIFVLADWTVLAPVGGIAIYERFMVDLHPMRLQLESKVGKKIMEYVWPARRDSSPTNSSTGNVDAAAASRTAVQRTHSTDGGRGSLDTHTVVKYGNRISTDEQRRPNLGLPPRRLTSSRSFNDLRSTSLQQSGYLTPGAEKSEFFLSRNDVRPSEMRRNSTNVLEFTSQRRSRDDAIEMKTRSAQKTFVLVQVSSMHILLSFNKDGSFFCRDARIQTRELKYRNQTWSFEELADQFIPSDTSWRGWMRMALHQPLIPVLPVAKELFSKTKWIAAKGKHAKETKRNPPAGHDEENIRTSDERPKTSSESSVSSRKLKKARKSGERTNLPLIR